MRGVDRSVISVLHAILDADNARHEPLQGILHTWTYEGGLQDSTIMGGNVELVYVNHIQSCGPKCVL